MITGFRCAACLAEVPVSTPWPWHCPRASATDRHHVLHRISTGDAPPPGQDPNPLVAYDARFAWSAFAAAHGMDGRDRLALVRELDAAVAAVDGTGFVVTPTFRSSELSDALGFSARGGVYVKDDTANVAGSHKARHLAGVLLHLLAAEWLGVSPQPDRPPLAIASCGNAALAAATLARAARWPLEVYVPPWASPAVTDRLAELGAAITVCPRQPTDPPGDPCLHRFHEAVARGAVPFAVQGPENGLCLDTGRTLGYELFDAVEGLDRVFVQVGGGALATDVAQAAADVGVAPRLHAVQTEGCAPLARAWARAQELGVEVAGRHWSACMWPWEQEPRSAADGILDDETYDWLGVVAGMAASGGGPVVVTEDQVRAAHELGARATGIPASPTGTAGLAGLVALRDQVGDDERVAVLFTGRAR